ncbi:MAG: hypothetical protein M1840_000144 [Geoglossum simile]|nr:MAG: hypothetical protein M1840_000144 [Geoglossum simile]
MGILFLLSAMVLAPPGISARTLVSTVNWLRQPKRRLGWDIDTLTALKVPLPNGSVTIASLGCMLIQRNSRLVYGTERELGIAIKESGVPRAELFVTTKVWRGMNDIAKAFEASLERLGLDYVDLYLIHTPFDTNSDAELQSAWAELETLQASGKARSIGVSNFYPQHLTSILKTAKTKPAINQIEFHTYLQHPQLQELQQKHDIALAAYGAMVPLTKARPGPVDEVVQRLSAKYNVGAEAVLLRWVMGQGTVAITTSGKESRLTDYLKATEFSLTPDEMREISAEGEKKHFRAYWTTRFHPGGSVVKQRDQ